jgi:hypothetical protein
MPMGWAPLGTRPFSTLPDRFPYSVPVAESEERKKRLSAYYEALGRFVDMFARVETAVTLTLWRYAKTEPGIAKVIFGGSKIDTYTKYIKQIAEATRAPKEALDDLEDVLQQLGIINGVRNLILHYGAESVAEGNAIVSNALKAKGEPTSFPISPTTLDQMTADCRKIVSHLNYRHLKQSPLSDLGISDLGNVFYATWQYKHPSQPQRPPKKAQGQRPQTRGPKQPRQPRPSRASRRKEALARRKD